MQIICWIKAHGEAGTNMSNTCRASNCRSHIAVSWRAMLFPFAAVKRRRTQGRSHQWRAHSRRPAFAFRSQRRAAECPGRSVALRGCGTGGGPWRLSTAHRYPIRRHAPPWPVRCGPLSARSTMRSTAVHEREREREQTSICSHVSYLLKRLVVILVLVVRVRRSCKLMEAAADCVLCLNLLDHGWFYFECIVRVSINLSCFLDSVACVMRSGLCLNSMVCYVVWCDVVCAVLDFLLSCSCICVCEPSAHFVCIQMVLFPLTTTPLFPFSSHTHCQVSRWPPVVIWPTVFLPLPFLSRCLPWEKNEQSNSFVVVSIFPVVTWLHLQLSSIGFEFGQERNYRPVSIMCSRRSY